MTTFQQTWQSAEYYLDNGISVIPVRDKPQSFNGREYPVKSAYPWAKWQKEIISKGELLHLMTDKYDTKGFGIVGGSVSGNLEIIDIDVKNWPGIDSRLFQDIRAMFPQLFDKLRIHQSPSKGYHILYRISDHQTEGNRKLAFKEGQKEAAIETRGEGGYVVASEAMGYVVVKNNPIPTITWSERCSLIAICEGYNERKKVIPAPVSSAQNDFYDQNPFDHFNGSPAAENVLIDNGWTLAGSSNNFIWFTRPGNTSGVSESFNREKRVYYIFTSSTQFEPSKGYNPATALALLQFGGDKKAAYKHLVDNGYGKIKAHREKKIAASSARKGIALPGNISEEARQLAVTIQGELTALHPYGTFWEYNDEGKTVVNREKLLNIAASMGFRYHSGNLVRIVGYLVHKVEERDFQDAIKEYIKEPEEEEYFKVANSYEAFMEAHGKFTMKRLPILDTSNILTDTQTTAYKFFANGFLKIDSESIVFNEYDSISDFLIWAEKLQTRNYNKGNGGKYCEFLSLATDQSQREHISRAIGYLCHDYKDETTGYIIVLTEQCADPKNGGGSGKNVFCNLLRYTTTYTSKPGSQTKFDEKFFQSWNGQRIFGISDVPKNFDFAFLKEPSTGSFIWKKLFKDEVEVSVEDAPKFIVQTNFSYEVTDGGLRRRIIPIEFTNFFTQVGGLDVHFGCHFPKGWTNEDWAGFDNFIAESIQKWLQGGRKLQAQELTLTGWQKQFEQTFGAVIVGLIAEYWQKWTELVDVPSDDFKIDCEKYYNENNIPKQYHPSSQRINSALRAYGEKFGVEFDATYQKKENGINKKYKIFTQKTPF
jgi:hypothetical protein